MYYEINVAKKSGSSYIADKDRYEHFFATAPRSITNQWRLKEVLTTFLVLFPKPEYNITVSLDKEVKSGVNIEEIITKVM